MKAIFNNHAIKVGSSEPKESRFYRSVLAREAAVRSYRSKMDILKKDKAFEFAELFLFPCVS
jgi:hypothetical protein